jgi:predicted MPP superfamily phosphohydrolase
MSLIACEILACGAVGHTVLWIALVNRIHAYGMQRRWIDWLTVVSAAMCAMLPIMLAAAITGIFPSIPASLARVAYIAAWTYLAACTAVLIAAILQRLSWFLHSERRGCLISNHTSIIRLADSDGALLAAGIPSWLGRLPGNEVLKVCLHEKAIEIPRLARIHEPLRIVHLTDLHMSGRITRKYFERVVEESNSLDADIVAITGDIIEREHCLDWIPATLGQLQAKSGVFYVLGNHDRRVNVNRIKAALGTAGLVHLGAECRQISVRGVSVVLGGNELPWFEPPSNFAGSPPHDATGLPLRILLAHSPDQFAWAQANEVDLVLAGHLHGGQVRLPIMGAIFSPSRSGVRYTLGVFTAGNTVMHVSRGTGSLTPLRFNCPPEISLLTLTTGRDR